MLHSDILELTNRIDLWTLGLYLTERQNKVRVLSDSEIGHLINLLASEMQERMPASVLQEICLIPIPRGGLMIAGKLAYALGLSKEKFEDDGKSAICIIDDCALTGKRFGETVKKHPGRDVWFCHLASSTMLRDAITKKEAQVRGCIAVHDLDLIDQNELTDFAADGRYLNRSVAHVAFPWTEPGLPVNVNGYTIEGWRLLPPHKVLGNHAMLKLPVVQNAVEPEIQLADQVVWRLLPNEGVRLYRSGDESMVDLQNLAADVWRGCVGYRNKSAVFEWLMKTRNDFDRKAVESLIDLLLARGMLVQL